MDMNSICPIPFSTGVDYESTSEQTKKIIDFILTTSVQSTVNGTLIETGDAGHRVELQIDDIQDTKSVFFPIIINLISPGRNGKDTFANLVGKYFPYETKTISCIDPSMKACDLLITDLNEQMRGFMYTTDELLSQLHTMATQKGEPYRQFLHDIKDAYSKYCNGPVLYVLSQYITMLKQVSMEYMKETTKTNVEKPFGILFVNNRDIDTVTQLNEWCRQLGIICLNVYMMGTHTSSDYTNTCDSNVDDIPYDIVINNRGSLGNLKERARMFAELLTWALRMYGIKIAWKDTFGNFISIGQKKLKERQEQAGHTISYADDNE